jgi:glycosyltransferase involved in cell wall biosynthesis
MNILYCDPQKTKSLQTNYTHIFGVLNGLSHIGHKVMRVNDDYPKSEAEIHATQSSLSGRIKNNLMRWRILKVIGGEVALIWYLSRAIYVFILTFAAITRNRNIDVLYRRHTLINSEYLLAKMFGIPLVKEVNGLVVDETKIMGWGNRISLLVLNWIERLNMSKADKIIVVTSKMKEVLHKEYKIPSDRIIVITNGANTELFRPMDTTMSREILKLNQNNSYVCFAGTFQTWHGLEYFIRSAPLILQECPEARFLMVGDGIMKRKLVHLAGQVGVSDKMIFVGMVPYQEVPTYINASDVCVIPLVSNPRNEKLGASPLKLYEYMACGKPVVTGDVEGASQDVITADSGLVVASGNVAEMVDAIGTLLKNEQLRKEMGERGRKFTVENRSWMKVAEKVAEVCQSVVKQKEGA